jgi:hypothetical protein
LDKRLAANGLVDFQLDDCIISTVMDVSMLPGYAGANEANGGTESVREAIFPHYTVEHALCALVQGTPASEHFFPALQ